MVYFHGNAEDLGHNFSFLEALRDYFGVSVLAMEYPGYGFYAFRVNNSKADPLKKLTCSAK